MARVPLELVLVNKVSAPLKKANASADKFANTIKNTNGKLRGSKKSLFGFGLGAKAAGAGAVAATPGIALFGAAINSALAPLAVLTTAAGLATAAIKGIADQDKANAALETLKVNSEELAPLLQRVSRELGHQASQTELTVAAYDVASAGFTKASDAAMVLKASALAAGAGMADLSTTGDAVTTVLNAWKMSASDAEKVADKMQQTVADGKIKINEYAANIGKVATTAAQLKVPLSEINALISQSTVSGVNAERAFTGVNAALAQIASGQAGKKLNMEMNAATLQSEGLFETLKKIAAVPVGLQIKALGREGHAALGPVLQDLEKYEKLLRNQEQSAGVAAAAQKKQADTIGGAWKEMTTVLGNAFSAQSELGEAVKLLIQITTDGLKLIGRFIEPTVARLNEILRVIVQIGKKVRELKDQAGAWLGRFFGPPLEETVTSKAAVDVEKIKTETAGVKENVDTVNTALNKTGSEVDKITTAADKLKQTWVDIGKTIGEGIHNAIKGVVQGTQSLGQTAMNVLNSIANKLLDAGISSLLSGLFPGTTTIGKFLGFANGGRPPVGQPSIVGERGPELFVPGSAGSIIPNDQLGGSNTTINISVDASGTSVEGDEGQGMELGRMISAAIQSELIREKRPGGLLA